MFAKVFGIFLSLILLLFLVFALSFEYITVGESDNKTSTVNSTRNAMTGAINLGNGRVNEELTISEEIAIEATLRQYADTSDFFDGDRFLNIIETTSDPAMISVDSYLSIDTPMQSMLNFYSGDTKSDETIGRSREIVIFEAKSITRP